MTLLGGSALWIAFLLGVWGAIAGFAGGRTGRPDLQRSARHAVFAMCAALLTAVFSLEWALFHHDFNIEYVAAYTSRNLPTFYTWSALYAGQKGSLLFWATVLTLFGSLAQLLTAGRHRVYLPYVAAVTAVVAAFFVCVMLFAANPFERLPYTPVDGRGLNPQLQNPGMVFHPPMLYLGYISITIPFAFAMAALLSKRLDADWLIAIRKWTLLSWLFLSVGICLGMWWAYVELGWGGYWAWDPVENASLLPWLTMTAFLHSVMIQEKRGMLKKWNLALIIGSWLLSILGTFITRSGVISSVHSFTQSPVGYFFLAFLVLAGSASFTLYAKRLPLLATETRLESMVSREASFFFNNLLLVGIAFSVLFGTLFPILSELVTGAKTTFSTTTFNRVNIPLGLALLVLTGIGPLIAWRRASIPNLKRQFVAPLTGGALALLMLLAGGMRDLWALLAISFGAFVTVTVAQEFWRGVRARHRQYGEAWLLALGRLVARNRRRYGGYVVHIGIVMLFVAFSGMAFKTETEATLRPGESVTLKSPYGWTYTFTHLGVSQYDALNRQVTAATVEVRRDGRKIGLLSPEKRQHVDAFNRPTFDPSTEPSIMSMLREDLYGVLGGVVNGTEQAVFRFTINPLVWWVWYGGMVVALGGLLVMWPGGGMPATKRSQAGYAVRLVGQA
ncbi:MAG: cytochrome C biogenesis protein [Gemmatimonadetes bacterium]|nr:MAG: cytochrome C biogenesis protein [Gemmatimonadota bacterium]PYO81407.1 MAG: cytochrome C biogenesis protein [Gemmatimonadota bacterium]PYP61817.1 MAG: cytochrome C biogenesis protein [Gemmatimonadota bacterium]